LCLRVLRIAHTLKSVGQYIRRRSLCWYRRVECALSINFTRIIICDPANARRPDAAPTATPFQTALPTQALLLLQSIAPPNARRRSMGCRGGGSPNACSLVGIRPGRIPPSQLQFVLHRSSGVCLRHLKTLRQRAGCARIARKGCQVRTLCFLEGEALWPVYGCRGLEAGGGVVAIERRRHNRSCGHFELWIARSSARGPWTGYKMEQRHCKMGKAVGLEMARIFGGSSRGGVGMERPLTTVGLL
jgi:hypothetical protein